MSSTLRVPYRDRRSAGQFLAQELACYAGLENTVILAISPGSVLVAAEVARALRATLDVFVLGHICLPTADHPCVGTMVSGGVCVLNQELLRAREMDAHALAETVVRVREQVMEREQLYRRGRPPLELAGQNVVLVDDGSGVGRNLRSAVAAIRSFLPASVSVATPVASPDCLEHLRDNADELICLHAPEPFYSAGLAYERFSDVDDETVCECIDALERADYEDPTLFSDLYLSDTRDGVTS